MTPDPLVAAIKALRNTPVTPGPPAELVNAAERLAGVSPRHRPWLPRLSWAAVVALAVGLTAYVLAQRPPSVAFADVVQNVRQAHSIEATADVGGVVLRVWIRGDQMRVEGEGVVQIVDLATGQALSLTTADHLAKFSHGKPNPFDVYGFLTNLHTVDARSIGERTLNGRRTAGFTAAPEAPDGHEVPLTAWVDPTTKLPVEIEVGPIVVRNIVFDHPLDDHLFALTPPDGYRLAREVATRYAGQVVDDRGGPLAGVEVSLQNRLYYISSRAVAMPVESATTDTDGRFSITGTDHPAPDGNDDLRAPDVRLVFRRSDLLYAHLEDVHLLSPEQRGDLAVRLRHGASLSGRVIDLAGHPVGGVRVRAIFGLAKDDLETRSEYFKTATTDAAGRFELRGLAPGKAAIGAIQAGTNGPILCGQVSVDLGTPVKPVEIAVRPLDLPPGTAIHELLGMRLTDVTPGRVRDSFGGGQLT